ncbi:EDD domain protein, DegV family [Georgenia satyanarayanai]|uniref:EDD domain protein, DegV family n=1 Tax=Georgenia satyanarayanai TaxID=860221 RepID=A0A2Y8ZVJ4_9MICO|nr:DegV family protein [Georgenia satyanarayanai]PYG01590.1 DegV family protein with EDD domain [Georgenia satyanarayanai]SSA36390.1 EDD domain protein, DegV family [Georgenia satyanarayanai]
MPGVVVLTDSTASVSPETAQHLGVRVVPLRVLLDGADHPDDALSREELAAHLRAGGTATTSGPSRQTLADAMEAAVDDGATAVVCVHLSAELSGTVGHARLAAEEVTRRRGIPVHVVDTRTVGGGTGFAALAAAERAARGDGPDSVLAAARETAARSSVLFAVPDLHHLARGGRIGPARAFLGSALGVRPILALRGGRLAVAETARGAARTRRRIVELAVRAAGGPGAATPRGDGGPVRVAVHHFTDTDAADALTAALEERLAETGAQVASIVRSEVTAVVGAHTGPGVVGVALAPAGC